MEQQQANAKLVSANNDLHADCTVAYQEDIDAIASMALETGRNLTLATNKVRQQVSQVNAARRQFGESTSDLTTVPLASTSLSSAQVSAINVHARQITAQAETITAQTESIIAIRATIDQAANNIATNVALAETSMTVSEDAIIKVDALIESVQSDLRYFHATLGRHQSTNPPVSPEGGPTSYTPAHLRPNS